MVHDNFKKFMRRFLTRTTGIDTPPTILDLTDITGYTGSDATNDTLANYITYQGLLREIPSGCYVLEVHSVDDVIIYNNNSGTYSIYYMALIGNSIESNEPEYSLGQILRSGLSLVCSLSCSNEIIYTTTIYNTSDSDKIFNEIGFFRHIGFNSSNVKWNSAVTSSIENKDQLNFLLIKEVLPQPMTLPAQSSININFNLFGDTPASLTIS